MGIASEYIRNLIAKQLNDNGIVVWYDLEGAWSVPEAQMNSLRRFHVSMDCGRPHRTPRFPPFFLLRYFLQITATPKPLIREYYPMLASTCN